LKPRRVNQVKKEIRILGVSVRREDEGYLVVGVVFRGGLWLDGVMKEVSKGSELTSVISTLATRSSHAGQIRIILLDRDSMPPEVNIDLTKLYDGTGKPVILIGYTDRDIGVNLTWGKSTNGKAVTAVGVSCDVARHILETATRTDDTPEVLRVASAIISALPRGRYA
jgi:endonuclease V-like protein UPF0215 family